MTCKQTRIRNVELMKTTREELQAKLDAISLSLWDGGVYLGFKTRLGFAPIDPNENPEVWELLSPLLERYRSLQSSLELRAEFMLTLKQKLQQPLRRLSPKEYKTLEDEAAQAEKNLVFAASAARTCAEEFYDLAQRNGCKLRNKKLSIESVLAERYLADPLSPPEFINPFPNRHQMGKSYDGKRDCFSQLLLKSSFRRVMINPSEEDIKDALLYGASRAQTPSDVLERALLAAGTFAESWKFYVTTRKALIDAGLRSRPSFNCHLIETKKTSPISTRRQSLQVSS